MFKVIFEQAAKDLTKQKLLSVLIAVMFAVGLFLTIGIAGYYSQNETKLSDFYKVYGEEDYKFKANAMSTAGCATAGVRKKQANTSFVLDFLSFVHNVLKKFQ